MSMAYDGRMAAPPVPPASTCAPPPPPPSALHVVAGEVSGAAMRRSASCGGSSVTTLVGMPGPGATSPCGDDGNAPQPATAAAAAAAVASSVPPAAGTPGVRAHRTACRDISAFVLTDTLGRGTYGDVYRSRDPETGEAVAVKKLKKLHEERGGVPRHLLREIHALRELRHPNIVRLVEMVTGPPAAPNRYLGDVYMVFELAAGDLDGLLRHHKERGTALPPAAIRSYAHQTLSALAHMHGAGWVHRDLKCANLLLTAGNVVKVADFGLARAAPPPGIEMTPQMVTLWYRAPEVLLQDPAAREELDVWSAGCILAELCIGAPLFCGNSALQQLGQIFKLCGTPSPSAWPTLRTLPAYQLLGPKVARPHTFRTDPRFASVPPLALDLIIALLAVEPSRRLTAAAALRHPYFTSDGGVPPPDTLPPLPLAGAAAGGGSSGGGGGAAAAAAAGGAGGADGGEGRVAVSVAGIKRIRDGGGGGGGGGGSSMLADASSPLPPPPPPPAKRMVLPLATAAPAPTAAAAPVPAPAPAMTTAAGGMNAILGRGRLGGGLGSAASRLLGSRRPAVAPLATTGGGAAATAAAAAAPAAAVAAPPTTTSSCDTLQERPAE